MNTLIDQICADRKAETDIEAPDLSYWELMSEWLPTTEPELPSP